MQRESQPKAQRKKESHGSQRMGKACNSAGWVFTLRIKYNHNNAIHNHSNSCGAYSMAFAPLGLPLLPTHDFSGVVATRDETWKNRIQLIAEFMPINSLAGW